MKLWIWMRSWPFHNICLAVAGKWWEIFLKRSFSYREKEAREGEQHVPRWIILSQPRLCTVCQGKLFSFVSGGGGGSGGAGVVCDLIIISLLITIECASLFIACHARAWIETNSASNLSKHASYYQIFAQCSHSGSTCKLIKVTPSR